MPSTSYKYEEQRDYVLTPEGQIDFVAVMQEVDRLFEEAGACRAGKLLEVCKNAGDTWSSMAVVDYLLQMKIAREIVTGGAWQDRIFVRSIR